MESLRDRYLVTLGKDPLSDQARSQHRNLLLVASLAILVSELHLVPTKISALGVNIESSDQHVIRIGLLIAVLYFTAAFLVAAISDFSTWLVEHRDARAAGRQTASNAARFADEVKEREANVRRDQRGITTAADDLDKSVGQLVDSERRLTLYRVLVPINLARAAIDFGVPVAAAIVAIIELAITLS